jgi:hypothetical protein
MSRPGSASGEIPDSIIYQSRLLQVITMLRPLVVSRGFFGVTIIFHHERQSASRLHQSIVVDARGQGPLDAQVDEAGSIGSFHRCCRA